MLIDTKPNKVLERIPSSNQVRARLACNLREAALLRRLLKLAVAKEREAKGSDENPKGGER